MKNNRMKRVNSELQKAIYEAINKLVVGNFPGSLVSVMEVDTTEDFDIAKVYLSFFSLNNKYDSSVVFNEIVKKATAIRTMVAHNVKLRFMPELKFLIDTSLEDNKKIEDTLKKINL